MSFEYPYYFLVDAKMILIFKSAKHMFKIEPIGTNKNSGLIIDEYTSKGTVKKYQDYRGEQITKFRLEKILDKLFTYTKNKII
jgi:hypothetical protein